MDMIHLNFGGLWSTCRQPKNYIQKLALKLFAITPHQAAYINRLESMAQIHSYYITNAKVELKFSSSNLSEDELETALREDDTNNNFLMTDIMNLNDFREQIDENSDSRIQQSDELVDYKDSDIDFEAILDDEELVK
ncbi:20389_t:CDS:2 [Rhizophagus irregularis]|nr:20389_t:CDS:2 [Rhizophagus irregularis]